LEAARLGRETEEQDPDPTVTALFLTRKGDHRRVLRVFCDLRHGDDIVTTRF